MQMSRKNCISGRRLINGPVNQCACRVVLRLSNKPTASARVYSHVEVLFLATLRCRKQPIPPHSLLHDHRDGRRRNTCVNYGAAK